MEPRRIRLKNFLSYRDAEIDLAPVRLAAIVGRNGSGKSSLVDSLVWALYGQGSRGSARDLDRYVTHGQAEGMVDLEFALGGELYRVVRSRSVARNKTSLEFYRWDGSGWRPIGGKTVAETQQAIESVLRMDYRTFTASSLILQGQADALTADMTDQERKEVLARILGLDLWARMQEAARERARAVRAHLQALEAQVATLQQKTSQRAEVEALREMLAAQAEAAAAETTEAQEQVASLEAKAQGLASLRQQLRELEARATDLESQASRLEADIALAEGLLQQLQDVLARRQEIEAAVQQEQELAARLAEWEQKAVLDKQLVEEIQRLERVLARRREERRTSIASIESKLAAYRQQAALLGSVPCGGTELQTRCQLLAGARRAAEEMQRLEAELAALQHAGPDPDEDRLVELMEQRDALAYDPAAHQAVRQEIQRVQPIARLNAELRAAEARLVEVQARLADLREQLRQAREEHARLMDRAHGLRAQIEAAPSVEDDLAAARARLQAARQQEAAVREQLGRVSRQLEEIAEAEEALQELVAQQQALREQAATWEILDQACSPKGGVPALIIENAVPQIEAHANDILARTTDCRLSVRLDTQAETKSGTTAEVLRITVLDGGQERPYQTYSGAERFLVDLALRLALSKFLAHRAGAEIGLLVLDEGLGVADAVHRDRIIEAIKQAAEDFRKVLVITHIEALQDALPQRIEVVRGPDGSEARVVT